MFNTIWKFINYWYFRYSLVTEFYMVEKWETVMMHIVFAIIFGLIAILNWKITLFFITWALEAINVDDFKSLATDAINSVYSIF